ncbi:MULTISPECIES: hypothetical protein [Methylomonas]|uniref:Uncharacterized protein n=1 Tax=Methylomonas koyamae TaxID=702114 RepID=A0A177NAJ2_9GAMM|nr:hypothetical protein [Methylomonas koyamae]OAI14090.1 hypothetical protein A1355_12775 [Methylomonas koyamae]
MAELQSNEAVALSPNDSAVIKTLEMYQAIITRMAGNSAACKQWCIPLVTVILAFAVKESKAQLIPLTLIPLLICYLLDAYYLMLENRFRAGFQKAAAKVAEGTFKQQDLFQLLPAGSRRGLLWKACTSPATWPVYLGLLALLLTSFKLTVGSCWHV